MSANDVAQARHQTGDEAAFDRPLMIAVAALLSVGVVMVYSASIAADSATLRINLDHLLRQLAHVGVGLAALAAGALVRLAWLQYAARALLLIALALLVAVLIPGVGIEVNGSARWIGVAEMRLQPSELMKVVAVIYFADYFARKHDQLHRFRVGIVNVGVVVGAIGALLLLEPDFGATAVIWFTVAAMMFLAGVSLLHFALGAAAAGALLTAAMWMEPYRIQRLIAYLDPWADPFGSGFQLAQALIAIGRGEWLGVGIGGSIQKLFYLPHAGNDFLIAVIGEELGAAGIFAVLMLFVLLLWRAFAIGARALRRGQRFAGLLAQGLGVLLALQAVVHAGVNTGVLPTKGLTLPLVSYGGSSLIASMAAVGLLFAVDRAARPAPRSRK
ncbi:MAG: putative lipid II flippase FtsW [bacterium]